MVLFVWLYWGVDDGLFLGRVGRKESARLRSAAERGERGAVEWPVVPGGAVYADDDVMLVLGDCVPWLESLPDGYADVCITDPPYSEHAHRNMKGNVHGSGVKRVKFDSFTFDDLRDMFTRVGRVTRRWVIATVDYRHAVHLEENPPEGLRVLRLGVWVKTHPMPSISGDRPGMGWESVIFMHTIGSTITWNGGGRSSVWIADKDLNPHPTAKPQKVLRDWVRLFSEPGDMVLDPFAGSASTLVAAKAEGRRGLGFEIDPRWSAVAVDRLGQGVLI